MTKKEIIRQELGKSVSIPSHLGDVQSPFGGFEKKLEYGSVMMVDLDKLAEFLAKHLDIKSEDLIQ